MFKPADLLAFLPKLTTQNIWLGYSGGLDSHVLLHALVSLINNKQLDISLAQMHAIYINHGWSQQAKAWDQHCQQVCRALRVDYHSINIQCKTKPGTSPEANARTARYAAFSTFIQKNDLLLTAHQQDDQAETLLLQLLRGTGIKGLAGMSRLTVFGNGLQLRPLLNFSRAALLAYAKQHKLKWIEDDSNINQRFARNFLRHSILPKLKQRWPQVNSIITRTAEHCATAAQLIDELAAEDFLKLQGTQPNTLACQALLMLSLARQQNVLRYWIIQLKLPPPSTIQLKHILQDVLRSKNDSHAKVVWQGYAIKRYQDNLHILNNQNLHDAAAIYSWDLTQPLFISALGTLTAALTPGKGIRADNIQVNQLTIRFRRSGERCQPTGRQGSHPLKKLFQEWQVPPWLRQQIPLLYYKEQLVAVIGYCVCEPFAVKNNENGWVIQLIACCASVPERPVMVP